MSPIDDELRAALHGRAQVLAPSSDPLAGIERRAKRIQRHRVGAAVAGSALAVAMIAVAVPAIQNATSSRPDVPTVATAGPSVEPSPAPAVSDYALDPTAPWAYRGVSLESAGLGTVGTIEREYATVRGVAESAVQLTPLFGQVYEPSQQFELVFLAEVDGGYRWGVATAGEGGPELLWDEALPEPAMALAAALPGDEVSRLLVVADPAVSPLEYGQDSASEWTPMAELGPGVATVPLEGDPAIDQYRLLDGEAEVVHRAPAPDPKAAEQPVPEAPPGDGSAAPSNAIDWPTRGSASPELVEEALASFARTVGTGREDVDGRLLYGAERDGRNVLLLTAWQRGQDARTFTYVEAAGSGSGFLDQVTAPGPSALAVLIPARTVFSDDDWLLVVPEPRAGQVLYSPDGGDPQPAADQGTEVAVLLDRPAGRTGDRLLILDGNGDPDRPIYRGTVEELLQSTSG